MANKNIGHPIETMRKYDYYDGGVVSKPRLFCKETPFSPLNTSKRDKAKRI